MAPRLGLGHGHGDNTHIGRTQSSALPLDQVRQREILREVRYERRFTRCADRHSQSSRDGIEPLEQIFSRSGSSDEAYGSPRN
jgi:hypothetical protein